MYLLDPNATTAVEADSEYSHSYMGESPIPEQEVSILSNCFVKKKIVRIFHS